MLETFGIICNIKRILLLRNEQVLTQHFFLILSVFMTVVAIIIIVLIGGEVDKQNYLNFLNYSLLLLQLILLI